MTVSAEKSELDGSGPLELPDCVFPLPLLSPDSGNLCFLLRRR